MTISINYLLTNLKNHIVTKETQQYQCRDNAEAIFNFLRDISIYTDENSFCYEHKIKMVPKFSKTGNIESVILCNSHNKYFELSDFQIISKEV